MRASEEEGRGPSAAAGQPFDSAPSLCVYTGCHVFFVCVSWDCPMLCVWVECAFVCCTSVPHFSSDVTHPGQLDDAA